MRHDLTDQRTDGARLQGVAGLFEWIACGAVRQGLLEAAKRHRMQCGHQRHPARGSYHHLRKALRGRHLRAIGNLNYPEVAFGRGGCVRKAQAASALISKQGMRAYRDEVLADA